MPTDTTDQSDTGVAGLIISVACILLFVAVWVFSIMSTAPQPIDMEYSSVTPCDGYTGQEYLRCVGSYTH